MINWVNTGLVEASDMGFPPGVFPEYVPFTCADGSVRDFTRTGVKRNDGEVEEVTYRHRDTGLSVVVFND